MKNRALWLLSGLVSLHIVNNNWNEYRRLSKILLIESFVFEPFTWFFTILFFIVAFLSFSKVIFYSFFPLINKYERFFIWFIFLLSIILYKLVAILIIIIAFVYAIMDAADYSRRMHRYSKGE
ncbi:hypothetical protein QA612_08985 [Evansella sp. AB-P1]|uniref:hypothetical protein n=1 Tax=Evansella sp. AB-P1 TaxID=3037653 RepID=UPI00241D1A95|nr:hypothetical protein [Evansella sp. AB-P1]MDG5787630.1 hypothetical protein [Evansella sp. AB-P1]